MLLMDSWSYFDRCKIDFSLEMSAGGRYIGGIFVDIEPGCDRNDQDAFCSYTNIISERTGKRMRFDFGTDRISISG